MTQLATFIATAGYVGYVPFAPGTAGSIAGLIIHIALRWFANPMIEGVAVAVALGAGLWSAGVVEQQLGKDPSVVVIDEVAGMLITLAFLAVTPVGAMVAFVLFRLYDVLKPYPAGRLEHLHGGPGIMLDDAMAGLYAQLSMRVVIALFPGTLA